MVFGRTVAIKLLLFLIVAAAFAVGFPQRVAAEPIRVAVVPYINSSGENRSVVDETISSKLEAYFQTGNYILVPASEVANFLASSGYDTTPMLLPEKEVLAALADATGANAVLAMDFARIQVNRRYSWFNAYTTGSVSIYVKALSIPTSNFVSLRIEKQERLKASRFGPGIREKVALGAGIESAMDEMFAKLPF